MKPLGQVSVFLSVACLVLLSSYVLSEEPKTLELPANVFAPTVVEKKGAVPLAKGEIKGVVGQIEGMVQERVIVRKRVAAAKAQVVQAPIVLNGAIGIGQGQLDPLIAQFQQQYRPLVRSELHFIRQICKPTDDQRKSLAKQAGTVHKDLATKFAKLQQQMNAGQWRWGSESPTPRQELEKLFLTVLKTTLSPEQVTHYEHELNQRKEEIKTVAIRNLVAKLDQDLVLSAEQREKISESLRSEWNDTWCLSLDYVQYFDQFFPNIPDKVVAPFLNKMQKTVWDGISKNQRIFLGIGNQGQVHVDELAFKDDVIDAAKDAPPAAAPGFGPAINGGFMIRMVAPAIEVKPAAKK